MSILVKGMKMPKCCNQCFFGLDVMCYLTKYSNSKRWYCGGKYINCPLVEIPSHGKLIDANALMSVYSDSILDVACVYGPNSSEAGILVGAMKLLEVQPTVIEAEGAE